MSEETGMNESSKQSADDLPVSFWDSFEVIDTYTRAQAIEDGVLVDLAQYELVRLTSKHPVACTGTLWHTIEEEGREDDLRIAGIVHDIFWMAQLKYRSPGPNVRLFEVMIGRHLYKLKIHVGPGDFGEPVITLMFENED